MWACVAPRVPESVTEFLPQHAANHPASRGPPLVMIGVSEITKLHNNNTHHHNKSHEEGYTTMITNQNTHNEGKYTNDRNGSYRNNNRGNEENHKNKTEKNK